MSLSLLPTSAVLINQVAVTVYGVAPGATLEANFEAHAKDNGIDATLNLLLNSAGLGSDANFNAIVLANLGLASDAVSVAYMESSVAASGRLATMKAAFDFLGSVAGQDNQYGTAGTAFNSKVTKSIEYSSVATNTSASSDAVSAAAISAGNTFTLTTGADSGTAFGGSINNDTFNSVIGTNATTANGTTLNPGDNLSGGTGADTLNVSVAGTHTAAQTVSAVTLAGIESVMVSNFQTDDNFDTTIDLSLADGVTTLGVSSSAATGDTLFTGVKALAAAEMKFGAGDLSITYVDTAVSGSADTQTLALEGVTAGTFTAAAASTGGVETLAITSSGTARNVLTAITNDAALKTISVAGTQAATLGTLGAAVTTFDASGNSGGVTATLSATTTTTLTGSTGNDSFTSGTVLTTGSVAAGDGIDTLVSTADTVLASSTLGAKYTGFETLSISTSGTTANGTRAQDVSLVSGIDTVNVSTTATTANGDTTHGVTLSNLGATTNTINITGLANADTTATDDYSVTVTGTRAANTAADAMTLNLGTATANSGATAVALNSGAGAVILDVTLANEEAITVNSLGASGTNLIDDFTNTSATSMVFTGARGLTVDSLTSTVATSIDASAMTAAFINNNNAGAVASTITGGSGADTLTGGTKADTMSGNAGADSITGAAGNDVIDGGAGADTIDGGAGVDSLTGGAGDDVFRVTTVGDFIGLSAAESVIGGEGNDNLDIEQNTTITVAATDLLGLSSVDRITVDGTANAGSVTLTDAVYTANGLDTLRVIDGDLTAGTLTVDGSALTGTNAIHVTANTTGSVNDTLTGGAGADTFVFATTTGLQATDTVVGGAGTDTISLTASAAVTAVLTGVRTVENVVTTGNGGDVSVTVGADGVIATSGTLTTDASSVTNNAFDLTYDGSAVTTATKSQIVTGTSGADTITGGSGNDQITGGDGADQITGGAGIDNLSGGAGADRFVVATTGTGFTGLASAETVSGGAGTDVIDVAAGIVTIAATDLAGMTSIEEIEISNTTEVASLTLTDAIYASNGNASLTVDAATMTSGVLTLAASGLTAANSVTLDISDTTNSAANVINLGAGNDTVKLDQIALDGGTTIAGGSGTDTIEIEANTGGGPVTLAGTVTGFETIQFATAGAAGTYNMVTADANVASGETLTVNGSNLTGTLLFNGAAETNGTFALTGGAGADTLTGGAKADIIVGGAGADVITGGLLADTLTGNSGADIFAFTTVAQSNATNTDSITDFTSATDKLNITLDYTGINSGLTVDATVQTARAGTSLIQENLSGARGQATYDTTGSALYVNFNADNLLTTSDYKIAVNPGATATATIAEGDLNFVITGGTGADTITAGGGADTITAGAGADVITGGAGDDTITLGTGAAAGTDIDIVKFGASGALNGSDTISEFAVGSDKFDVTAFLTGATAVSATESEPTDLAAEGVPIAVATNKILFASAHATATTSFDSVADIVTGLADGGAFDAVDVAASAKALLFFGAAATATQMFVYAVENDSTAAVTADELTLIATVNGAADDVGNLVIATNFVVS